MKLKRCVRCGSNDVHIEKREYFGVCYYIVCNDCEYETDEYDSKSKLIKFWNKR
jgi:Lar family restriction alleviation protein